MKYQELNRAISLNAFGNAEKDIMTLVLSYGSNGIPKSEMPKIRQAEQKSLIERGVLIPATPKEEKGDNLVIAKEYLSMFEDPNGEVTNPPTEERLAMAKEYLKVE
jgi:hypothetical protein